MVIAAVEDLLFSSKIRTVARQLGVEVVFARSPEAILREIGARHPALVVFDLNATGTAPIETLAKIAAWTGGPRPRLVGFASHVQADTMAAARAAGADEVLPRSGFAANLANILAGA